VKSESELEKTNYKAVQENLGHATRRQRHCADFSVTWRKSALCRVPSIVS